MRCRGTSGIQSEENVLQSACGSAKSCGNGLEHDDRELDFEHERYRGSGQENVRVIVRELGTTAAETSQKWRVFFRLLLDSCRLACVGVYRKFRLRTRRSGVRVPPGAPFSSTYLIFPHVLRLCPSQPIKRQALYRSYRISGTAHPPA